jgi:hypothetical protein
MSFVKYVLPGNITIDRTLQARSKNQNDSFWRHFHLQAFPHQVTIRSFLKNSGRQIKEPKRIISSAWYFPFRVLAIDFAFLTAGFLLLFSSFSLSFQTLKYSGFFLLIILT